jgi:Ca2+-binding EF-hand superfamily protein
MKAKILTASALALALSMSVIAAPAHARADDLTFPIIFKMADKNNDGMVTKEEFLDAMGKAYDMKMNAMKADAKMVKGNMMTRDGLKSLLNDIYHGA